MTALTYTSGTAIVAWLAADGATLNSGGTALCATIAGIVNDKLEQYVQRPVGPAGTAARTYDGDGTDELWIPEGLTGITTLKIKDQTGGTYTTLTASEYVLRPASHKRPTGWPGFRIKLTDVAFNYTSFTAGSDTVEVTPDSSGFGWSAIPTELSFLAQMWGVRLYGDKGNTGQSGSVDFAALAYSKLSDEDYATLDRYRMTVAQTYVGGGG